MYRKVAYLFPQISTPNSSLIESINSLGKVLFEKEIFGYVLLILLSYISIKYVFFHDEVTDKDTIWAISLNIEMHLSLLSFNIFDFVSSGVYDISTNDYINRDKKKLYYISLPYLYHPNLCTVQYSGFFSSCKYKNIVYNFNEKSGTLFLLYQSAVSGKEFFFLGLIGIVTIGSDIRYIIEQFQKTIQSINNILGSYFNKVSIFNNKLSNINVTT